MYADSMTPSMAPAIDETNRRRAIQVAYNLEHGVDPMPLRKRIADITDMLAREDADTEQLLGRPAAASRAARRRCLVAAGAAKEGEHARELAGGLPSSELGELIQQLNEQMPPRPRSCSSSSPGGCATRWST